MFCLFPFFDLKRIDEIVSFLVYIGKEIPECYLFNYYFKNTLEMMTIDKTFHSYYCHSSVVS